MASSAKFVMQGRIKTQKAVRRVRHVQATQILVLVVRRRIIAYVVWGLLELGPLVVQGVLVELTKTPRDRLSVPPVRHLAIQQVAVTT